ncbi:hypothetical protein AGABI2DRAFT_67456 [Agaricus bisporus var. bisporus H97]|uniref:hypothetical protein n=1 Tax=Agaricus bisporus var. bisporus (strain H97 / ATCC MYA-4626 / FGSC 10389) TaxID=936046 RepID=UPI00029F6044|nr:hypothetical protein AGABI2DRAFT_67456 [Agaricus bisporus var. bisporus H97]EKV48638.1 hypothetical protein AGABI2DRAFT_67456 [Agaricus bisporus var. bisporus H97]
MTIKRAPYEGHKHKLIVAFDVGTTFSGVSYSILDHGVVPKIEHVTKFPGQAKPGADSKIPSIMYYDQKGKVCAIGEEADGDSVEEKAEDNNWIKLEWFKMHYRPRKSSNPLPTTIKIPPLPPTKSIIDILSDFLHYLNECTKQYIEDSHPGIGTRVLSRDSKSKIEYILSHPNRWDGSPRGLMRQAAEKAGLISPGGINEVTFISEGEASLNMCIEHDLLSDSIRKGDGVIVVDAGGGTIDFSAYALDKKKSGGKVFQEIVESQSHFMGSEFVTERLGDHLRKLLKGSKYQEDIPNMKKIFNKKTKCTFRDIKDPCFIHFGSLRDSDPQFKIIKGKLRLDGKTVASFINPVVDCIVDTVCEMRRNSSKPISTIFLVGGFANNDYLFNEVKNSLSAYGLTINRPGIGGKPLNKAVAEGAITYALDNPVRSRVMYRAYGVECNILYDPQYADHVQRISQCITLHSGKKAIPKGFHRLVSKAKQLSDTQELTCQYVRSAQYVSELREITKEVFCYQGNLPPEKYKWMDTDPSGFQRYFTVKANLSNVPISTSSNGGRSTHYRIEVNIILLLGGTEPKAQIAWKDSLVRHYSDYAC